MELPVAAVLLCVPTTIAIVGFNGAAAVLGLRTSDAQSSLLTVSRTLMLLLWISACVLAVIFRFAYRDWVHLFWSAQIPMVGLFFGNVRSTPTPKLSLRTLNDSPAPAPRIPMTTPWKT